MPPRNPFTNSLPTYHRPEFVGRVEEIQAILSNIHQNPPYSCYIVGCRKIGKTSLLRYLAHPHGGLHHLQTQDANRGREFVFVYIDLTFLEYDEADFQPVNMMLPFYRRFFHETHQVVKNQLIDRKNPYTELLQRLESIYKEYHYQDNYRQVSVGLYEYLSELFDREASGNFTLIFFLDEADALFRSGLSRNLRALLDTGSLAYIFTSLHRIEELDPEGSLSPLYSVAEHVPLGLLKKGVDREYILSKSAEAEINFMEEEIQFITTLGGCYPEFLRVAGKHALERKSNSKPVNSPETYESIYTELKTACEKVWRFLLEEEQQVIYAIVHRETNDSPKPAVVERLLQRGILTSKPSNFPFPWVEFSPIFADYVKRVRSNTLVAELPIANHELNTDTKEFVIENRRLVVGAQVVPLTPIEMALFTYFNAHLGELCTRQQLLDNVWEGADSLGEDKKASTMVNIAVQRLRDKLREYIGGTIVIESIRGKGYRMIKT